MTEIAIDDTPEFKARRRPTGIQPKSSENALTPAQKAAAAAQIDVGEASVVAQQSVTGRAPKPVVAEQRKVMVLLPESVYQQLRTRAGVKDGPTIRGQLLESLQKNGYVVPDSEIEDRRGRR